MYWLVWTLEQTINHTNLQGRFLKPWTQECPGNKENTVTTNQKSSNSIETHKLVQVFSFTRFRPEKKKLWAHGLWMISIFVVLVEMFLWGLLILNSVMNVCEDVYEQWLIFRASWWSESWASEVEQPRVQMSGGERIKQLFQAMTTNIFCAKAKLKMDLRFHCLASLNSS